MRQAIIFLVLMVFCSCEQKSGTKANQNKAYVNSYHDDMKTKNTNELSQELTTSAWTSHEDSLRNEILHKKKNKTLKESFLQEMYIRNVATVSKDSVFITIPFNLHGPDCGSPDCYSTDISFSFRFGDTLIFPQQVKFKEHEYGCVDHETQLIASFQLVDQTNKYVIYHSTKPERTLVLFSSIHANKTFAYYFTGAGQNVINGKNVYEVVKEDNDEKKTSIYPFTSWDLTTNEYENFLH